MDGTFSENLVPVATDNNVGVLIDLRLVEVLARKLISAENSTPPGTRNRRHGRISMDSIGYQTWLLNSMRQHLRLVHVQIICRLVLFVML